MKTLIVVLLVCVCVYPLSIPVYPNPNLKNLPISMIDDGDTTQHILKSMDITNYIFPYWKSYSSSVWEFKNIPNEGYWNINWILKDHGYLSVMYVGVCDFNGNVYDTLPFGSGYFKNFDYRSAFTTDTSSLYLDIRITSRYFKQNFMLCVIVRDSVKVSYEVSKGVIGWKSKIAYLLYKKTYHWGIATSVIGSQLKAPAQMRLNNMYLLNGKTTKIHRSYNRIIKR